MTVEDMIVGVNLGVQKVDAQAFDDLQTQEAEYYLNKANREYIRRQNLSLRQVILQQADDIERQGEVMENLGPLVVTELIGNANIAAITGFNNAKGFDVSDLSNTIFYYTFSQTQTEDGGDWRANQQINPGQITEFLKTSYNTPVFREYPILRLENQFAVFYDEEGGDVYDVAMTYIKEPDKLVESSPGGSEVTTPQLPPHTHDELIDLAVSMILEDFKSGRPHQPVQTITQDEGV